MSFCDICASWRDEADLLSNRRDGALDARASFSCCRRVRSQQGVAQRLLPRQGYYHGSHYWGKWGTRVYCGGGWWGPYGWGDYHYPSILWLLPSRHDSPGASGAHPAASATAVLVLLPQSPGLSPLRQRVSARVDADSPPGGTADTACTAGPVDGRREEFIRVAARTPTASVLNVLPLPPRGTLPAGADPPLGGSGLRRRRAGPGDPGHVSFNTKAKVHTPWPRENRVSELPSLRKVSAGKAGPSKGKGSAQARDHPGKRTLDRRQDGRDFILRTPQRSFGSYESCCHSHRIAPGLQKRVIHPSKNFTMMPVKHPAAV